MLFKGVLLFNEFGPICEPQFFPSIMNLTQEMGNFIHPYAITTDQVVFKRVNTDHTLYTNAAMLHFFRGSTRRLVISRFFTWYRHYVFVRDEVPCLTDR